jgi:hypothetical protein
MLFPGKTAVPLGKNGRHGAKMRAGAGRPLINVLSPDRRVLSFRARPRFSRQGTAEKNDSGLKSQDEMEYVRFWVWR